MNKPRNRESSILLTTHCRDKIHIFMKFLHHIPYGSDVVAYKQHFAKDRQFNSKKIKGYRLSLFYMVLMRYIFPGSFLKIA